MLIVVANAGAMPEDSLPGKLFALVAWSNTYFVTAPALPMCLYCCLFVWPCVLPELFYSNYFFGWCALYIQMWASSSQASPAAYCLDLVAWFRDGIHFVVFYSFHDLWSFVAWIQLALCLQDGFFRANMWVFFFSNFFLNLLIFVIVEAVNSYCA